MAVRRSGVKRIRFHDLRHSYASQMVMSGVSIEAVRKFLGHSELKMTQRYVHLTPASRQEAVKLLESKISSSTWSQSGHPPWKKSSPGS